MAYRWTITKDHMAGGPCNFESRVGTTGPRHGRVTKSNPSRWSAYDDDGECYYEGMIYGDYSGFEPLDDFAMPDSGCTEIRINGERL